MSQGLHQELNVFRAVSAENGVWLVTCSASAGKCLLGRVAEHRAPQKRAPSVTIICVDGMIGAIIIYGVLT